MPFKTELHAHTAEVSPCATMTAEQVVDRYVEAGYSTLVISNHFCDYVMDTAGGTWEQKVDHYLYGYRHAKEVAGDRIRVLLGCELRFVGSMNDYLILGITEEFLYSHPDLHRMSLSHFHPHARENGFLIIQAHPFRNGMMIKDPSQVDGYEVFNGHAGQHSRNNIADEWARRYGKLRTSGSDFHFPDSEISGGILTEEEITDERQLTEIIRTANCTLICRGSAAKRDGMTDMPAKY